MNDREYGKVVFIDYDKGYGFIEIANRARSVFFHARDVKHIHFERIRKGDTVEVDGIKETEKGFNSGPVYLVS